MKRHSWLFGRRLPFALGVRLVVVTALVLGALALVSGVTDQPPEENVTVDASEVRVTLNDELTLPSGDGVQTCVSTGPPPDSVGVVGPLSVDVPSGYGPGPFEVNVSLGHRDESTTHTLEETGVERVLLSWTVEDTETLAVGDDARLQIRVRSEGASLLDTTRRLPVENGTRSYDCS
ncbi:hypothetical protein ACAH01_03285 [Halomicrobium sp. HM KBTZ05]|uniref:hypothetical protein n=1 Tax=Halomicrobium sp. HM KBTZ05 TaxID=3242663 RepID=UPI0035579D5F